MVIVIVRFHNPKIHLVRNPQVVLFTIYDPHLVRKFFAQSSALSEDLL